MDLLPLLYIVRTLGALARTKGYPSFLAALGVVGWVVGGALGFTLAAWRGAELGAIAAYPVGAAIGAALAFAVVHLVPARARRAHDEVAEASS